MIMSNQALNELIQRFAISALSRERKAEALNEEILVGKYSGEFYIKTKEGIVLSADIMNRAKAATNEAVRIAELVGMTGDIYHVDFENLVLPGFVDYGDDILQQEPINIPVDAKELLIHLDLDEYNILNGDPQLIHSNGNVKILIEIVEDGMTRYVRVDKNLSTVNFNKIPLELKGKVSSIKIMNITIGKDANIGANNTILLHNIFVTINH
jgi:hypothetical protein